MREFENERMEEIAAKLEMQKQIAAACLHTHSDIKFLQGEEKGSEKATMFLREWDGLHNIQDLMWRYLILELCKLFGGNNEYYSLRKSLRFLKENYQSLPYKEKLTEIDIDSYLNNIESNEFGERFEKLKTIRDKYFAHLDVDASEISFSNEEADYFIQMTQQIVKSIEPVIMGGENLYWYRISPIRNLIEMAATYKGVYDKLEHGLLNPEERKKLKPETEIDLLRILGKRNFIVEGIE